MENLNMKFMKEVGRIKDPVIFLGLARTLGVNLYTEEKDENSEKLKPKEFSVLFEEMMKSFDGAGRKLKRDLIKMLRAANEDKEQLNATRTENTEATVQDEEV